MNARIGRTGRRLRNTLRKVIIIIPGFIAGFTVCYFAAVLAGGLLPGRASEVTADAGLTRPVILVSSGRHTDVWLPADACAFLPENDGWYGFGWGDRDFFLNTPYAADVRAGILLKALFLPSRPVLAVQYSKAPPEGRKIPIPAAGLASASAWIAAQITDEDGRLVRVPEEEVHPSYAGYSFFESRGRYSILFTSNNWANRLLKQAGYPSKLWTPLTFGLD